MTIEGLVLSIASDGIDNSPVAGAFVDEHMMKQVVKKRFRPKHFLEKNDSLAFFEKVGTAIKTGVTGVNVSDLMLGLQRK